MLKIEIREQKDGTWTFRHLGGRKYSFPSLKDAHEMASKQIICAATNSRESSILKVISR